MQTPAPSTQQAPPPSSKAKQALLLLANDLQAASMATDIMERLRKLGRALTGQQGLRKTEVLVAGADGEPARLRKVTTPHPDKIVEHDADHYGLPGAGGRLVPKAVLHGLHPADNNNNNNEEQEEEEEEREEKQAGALPAKRFVDGVRKHLHRVAAMLRLHVGGGSSSSSNKKSVAEAPASTDASLRTGLVNSGKAEMHLATYAAVEAQSAQIVEEEDWDEQISSEFDLDAVSRSAKVLDGDWWNEYVYIGRQQD